MYFYYLRIGDISRSYIANTFINFMLIHYSYKPLAFLYFICLQKKQHT